MELNDILRKVRQLVAVAEHESTPVEEAQAAREAADRLMLKFAIDEAELDASRPAESRSAPGTLDVDIPGDSLLVGYFAMMLLHVARHTRTKARLYTEWDPGTCTWKARVYGFESDLRYFEILYTTLLLHMSGVLVYKWDESKTVGENAYLLHEAGFNWVEMAEMRGWRKVPFHRYPDIKNPYRNAEGQVVPSNKFGPMFKNHSRSDTPGRRDDLPQVSCQRVLQQDWAAALEGRDEPGRSGVRCAGSPPGRPRCVLPGPEPGYVP
jgi:hypothetical protein